MKRPEGGRKGAESSDRRQWEGVKGGRKGRGGGSPTESLVLRSQVEPFEKIFRMFPVFRNNSEEVKSGRSHDL